MRRDACSSSSPQVFVRSAAPSRKFALIEYLHHGVYLGRQPRGRACGEHQSAAPHAAPQQDSSNADSGEPLVAELRRDGTIRTLSLAHFADGRAVYMDCKEHGSSEMAGEAVRAIALGRMPYNVVTSNCEHLSSFCTHGSFRSRQVFLLHVFVGLFCRSI